jgi:predicted nucleic acid-binding protein
MIAVLDASVALKWQFEDEEATGTSMALLEDFVVGKIDLISLTLFHYEIVNAINVAINRKRMEETIGYRAINDITSMGIELRSFNDLIEPTFRMARKYGLSPYDCAYIALAEKEKCDFFTGDKKLFHLIKNYFSWVKWVGDYRPL